MTSLILPIILGVASTIFFGYCLWREWKNRARAKALDEMRRPIGRLTHLTYDQNGIEATFQLYPDSPPMSINEEIFMRPTSMFGPIQKTKPCRNRNSNVCVAEGCYGEVCVK